MQGKQESNPHARFWRPLNYHCSIPLNQADVTWASARAYLELVKNLGNLTGTYGTSTLADCETETLVECDRSDEHNVDLNVVTRHNHLNSLWKSNLTGNVKSTDEELRTILVVERSMTASTWS